VNDLLP